MLPVQVEYWKHQENKRHNVATEGETNRHNLVTESQGWVSITEAQRHNKAVELETQRANRTKEALGFAELGETQRNNDMKNYISVQTLLQEAPVKDAQAEKFSQEADLTRSKKLNTDFNTADKVVNWGKEIVKVFSPLYNLFE